MTQSAYIPADYCKSFGFDLGSFEWYAVRCNHCDLCWLMCQLLEKVACPYCYRTSEPTTLLYQEQDDDDDYAT